MSGRWIVGLIVVMLFVFGCSHLHPWATDRDIEGTYDQVFQATLETLESRAFPIEQANRQEGRIVTAQRPVKAIEGRRRVEKVRAYVEEADGEDIEVQLILTFLDQSGTVDRGTREGEPGAATGRVVSRSAIYDDFLDDIEERVRELRGLDRTRLSSGSR